MSMRKTIAIGVGALMLALAGATVALTDQLADKLPKCSGKFCKEAGCSPEVLCVRGASVVTCAEVCGGH